MLVRRTERGWKYALSSTMVVVPSETSESLPPITPATACARSASAITSMSPASARDLTVERRQALARRSATDPEVWAGQPRQIERVQRMPGLEQHVVGDVDDVVDAANAGGVQPRDQPRQVKARP